MDFTEKINQLKERAITLKDNLQTEEATKNALIMPFIAALGYDVFNPLEVVPEFIADVGIKKGEKVDYCILKDGEPIILVECKKIEDSKLDVKKHATQLYRYFTTTKAKFIILTNGIVYKFFSDIEENGKLDNDPFFTFNLLNFKENQIQQLGNFSKDSFNLQEVCANASDLKYISKFVDVLFEEYTNPSPEFVKYFINKADVCSGRITPNLLEKHTRTTKEAFNSFISKVMKNVLEGNISLNTTKEETKTETKVQVETTIEELEGYAIVKSILNGSIDTTRVVYRDNASYFNVILDDNILKTICRLYFNTANKYIAFLNNKKEEKIKLENINDIFNHSNKIKEKVKEIEQNYSKK